MPVGFDRCRKQGGRIRTLKLKEGKYIHICYLGGKSYKGEVKTKKGENVMYDERPKYGKPRSDAQRRQRHKRLYGSSKLPPRGTGRRGTGGSAIANAMEERMRG